MSTQPIIQLEEFWPYQVVVLADLVSRHTNSILKSHGSLNLSQWRVLAAIAAKPGMSSAQVVTMTPMDKGIVSRAAASLVTSGLVRKKGDPADRRRSELFLTPQGQSQYELINASLTQALSQIKVPARLNNILLELISSLQDITSG